MQSSVTSKVGCFITAVVKVCESEDQRSEIWRVYQKRAHLIIFMGEDLEAEMNITTNSTRAFLNGEWFNKEVDLPQLVLPNIMELHSTALRGTSGL